MKFLDLTFETPAENLACDEALLDFFEQRGGNGVLRFWEPLNYFVVVGYANCVIKEVNVSTCEAETIPIFRRCSGGGTVLQGPGCLNYTLVAPIEDNRPLHSITSANHFIMEKNRVALDSKINPDRSGQKSKIGIAGHTDLVIRGLKFSGNAQRRKKHFILFHGTFLLNFNIQLIEKYLRMPSKEPSYRQRRSHREFLTNLDVQAEDLKDGLREAWQAVEPLPAVPHDTIALLARNKYVTKEWNFKF